MQIARTGWLPKVMAVVIAFALWLYVVNEQNPLAETTYKVKIEQRNLTPGMIVEEYPDIVSVKIRAPRLLLSKITHENVHAYLDLHNLRDGRYSMVVAADVPTGADVVEILPNTVIFRIYSGN